MASESSVSEKIVVVIFAVILTALAYLTHAFVLTTIWEWIAVAHLGLTKISFWVMFCIAEFIGLLISKPQLAMKEEDSAKTGINFFMWAFVMPWLTLLVVYLVKCFAL